MFVNKLSALAPTIAYETPTFNSSVDSAPRPVSFRAFIQMCDSGIGEKEEFSVKKTDSLQKQINKHEGLLDVEMDVMRKATAQH